MPWSSKKIHAASCSSRKIQKEKKKDGKVQNIVIKAKPETNRAISEEGESAEKGYGMGRRLE